MKGQIASFYIERCPLGPVPCLKSLLEASLSRGQRLLWKNPCPLGRNAF
jgi:hypothetical protein